MAAQAPSGGLSLFPNTGRPPSRNQNPTSRAGTPSQQQQQQQQRQQDGSATASSAMASSPPRSIGRATPLGRTSSRREGKQPAASDISSQYEGRQSPAPAPAPAHRQSAETEPVLQQHPLAAADIPARCETAFSEANTLVREASVRSHSSIAKRPFFPEVGPSITEDSSSSSSGGGEPAALRSIFPQYNPNIPLDRQDYYPTQASPTHIPRAVISRPLYSPTDADTRTPHQQQQQQQQQQRRRGNNDAAMRSPPSTEAARNPPARALHYQTAPAPAPAAIPPTSTNEELAGLWKVACGFPASQLEACVYCLRLTPEKDTPIYTLSSESNQPFYSLRVEPTSASAYVSLSRHNPQTPYKATHGVPGSITSSTTSSYTTSLGRVGKRAAVHKNWHEALNTTLEEPSRRLPPNDGLVALLYPRAAARLALEKPDDPASVARAENECARLVWDAESNNSNGDYYLVHPALALPFCVTIERSPAWSRTEYTLEHIESPQHLARLTRDGTGSGWLEIDTGIAGKIDGAYIVDVAVTALLLVAHGDVQVSQVEVFEPPPVLLGGGGGGGGSPRGSMSSEARRGGGGVVSRMSGLFSSSDPNDPSINGGTKSKKNKKKNKKTRLEEFELDIECQTSELQKMEAAGRSRKKKDNGDKKLPGAARGLIKVLSVTFKCFIWIATMLFRALTAVIGGLAKCLTSEKL